ncbi:prolyl 4-hydroxylase subunit alpha-1-like [Mizuhopecten yessoensis]|uniref:prolyl 4-hydroxylase subunit alpha-1-like n=1 Tax=Mizuhopecten yessoensis TaxID=6573 RepID=UPI000B45A00D|nr:prolyl 4-hydroxylase subunit alpha-1-like [Mizuhopecten yessoensis]
MGYTWCGVLMLLTAVTAEVATSGYKLTVVCQKERQLVEALDRYVTITLSNQSHVDETVQRFLRDVKEERSRIDVIAEWIGHPINAFHLVERTVNGWREVQQNINCITCVSTTATQEFHTAWKGIIEEDGIWSSSDDVITAAKGLGRLYATYDLDIKKMISGTILNTSTSPLTTPDVIKIANYLEIKDQIKWYEAFLELLGDVTKNESILYKLAIAYHLGGMSSKALGILTELQATSTRSMDTMIKNIRKKAEMIEEDIPQKKIETVDDIHNSYQQLCQGNIQAVNVTPVLHCYNKVTRIPFYTVKEEVLSDVPRISRFHDVISDADISQLQDITKPNLTRAKVFTDGIATAIDNRIGETAFVSNTMEICLKMEKRIELITGLDTIFRKEVKTTEKFQVVNYGIGGHYSFHYDALDVSICFGTLHNSC